MRTFSKSPKVVKKMASPPRVPPESRNVTGTTEKVISPRSSASNLPINSKYPSKSSALKSSNIPVQTIAEEYQVNHLQENQNQNNFHKTGSYYSISSQMNPAIFKIEQHGLQYEGTIVDGMFDGFGTLYDPREPKSRFIYKGQWREGARNGKGKYVYPDHSQYDGEWLDNWKHGKGKYATTEGQYQGQWSYGKKNGTGKMTIYSSGQKLEGLWKDDQFVAGKITYEDGSEYNGQMKDYERHGNGTYTYLDNSEYNGNWSNNQKQGKGRYIYSNGDTYDGEFSEGKRNGSTGRYIWKDHDYEIVDSVYENDRLVEGKIYQSSLQNVVKTISKSK